MRNKRKPARIVNKTKLIVGEGMTEKNFLTSLHRIYYVRGRNYKISIDEAGGGDPKSIIAHAINSVGHYDEKCVFIDSDRAISQQTRKIARIGNVNIIQAVPICIEGFLLHSLGDRRQINTAHEAKQYFNEKFNSNGVISCEWFGHNFTDEIINDLIIEGNHDYCDIFSKLRVFFAPE
ncbi:TPA: hypothetical protein U5E10_001604 [Yersinia enterocolitica]|nr:hypothetical protein [Yersinia enterocolitica]HEK5866249.1 hypothetical protein [Yersinia enterocolitica]HEN3531712.1 hypothetical protein [Yersinia enterocolitica]HEP1966002.1 hypothetical protein [Yersinia enterocolitica]